MEELGSVSTNTPNELLAWATFMGNEPLPMVRQSNSDLQEEEYLEKDFSLKEEDFWEKAYYHKGKIQRKYHDTKRERLRKKLKEKNIIRKKGLSQKNRKAGPRPKKYSFNVKWLGEYLHTGHKINLNEKEAETLVALEKFYNTELVRKLLSPDAQLIRNHETGETHSTKDLVFDTELSHGEIRSLYSFSVINLPFMILIGRYIDAGEDLDLDTDFVPEYLVKTMNRGIGINVRLKKGSVAEEDYEWAKEKLNMILPEGSSITNFGSSFDKADKKLVSDNSIEVMDEVMDVLMPSYISSKLHQENLKQNFESKKGEISRAKEINIEVETNMIKSSENIIMNKTEIGRQIAPALFQEA